MITPILYIDAIHYSVFDNGVIHKLATFVILGLNADRRREELPIIVRDDNESSKYWLSMLNQL